MPPPSPASTAPRYSTPSDDAYAFVTQPAATLGTYLDVLANRLIFQPMKPAEKDALIKFLGAKADTRVTDNNLGGKLPLVAPLVLDSVYHALR